LWRGRRFAADYLDSGAYRRIRPDRAPDFGFAAAENKGTNAGGPAADLVRRFWELQTSARCGELAALFAPDSVFTDQVYGVFEDHSAVGAYLRRMETEMPDEGVTFTPTTAEAKRPSPGRSGRDMFRTDHSRIGPCTLCATPCSPSTPITSTWSKLVNDTRHGTAANPRRRGQRPTTTTVVPIRAHPYTRLASLNARRAHPSDNGQPKSSML